MTVRVVLASGSPRRHELLRQIGVSFATRVPDIDESPHCGERPVDYVRRVAREKATAARPGPDELVIAADTTVDVDSSILAKPADAVEAAAMLRTLSGRTHLVHTGVSMHRAGHELTDVCSSSVEFVPLDETTIDWYIATGEPFGKAGAYGIQGKASLFIEEIEGDYFNIMGLPIRLVYELSV